MIKFFRKIRQKLLSQNKVSNYFFYAIGEIVLVVIGILIALQINTWNENNKNKSIESEYITELLEDFQLNLQKSNEVTSRIKEVIPTLTGLLEQSSLEIPTISVDSMNNAFKLLNSMPAYSSTDRAYNNLIGSGDFKLITSSEIKNAIADYYKALDILKLVQNTHEMQLVNAFQPYIIENLDYQAVSMIRVENYTLPKPVEKDRILSVLHVRKFRNIITLKFDILTDLLELNQIVEEINKKLVKLLKDEVSKNY